jgi:hypothetical protein
MDHAPIKGNNIFYTEWVNYVPKIPPRIPMKKSFMPLPPDYNVRPNMKALSSLPSFTNFASSYANYHSLPYADVIKDERVKKLYKDFSYMETGVRAIPPSSFVQKPKPPVELPLERRDGVTKEDADKRIKPTVGSLEKPLEAKNKYMSATYYNEMKVAFQYMFLHTNETSDVEKSQFKRSHSGMNFDPVNPKLISFIVKDVCKGDEPGYVCDMSPFSELSVCVNTFEQLSTMMRNSQKTVLAGYFTTAQENILKRLNLVEPTGKFTEDQVNQCDYFYINGSSMRILFMEILADILKKKKDRPMILYMTWTTKLANTGDLWKLVFNEYFLEELGVSRAYVSGIYEALKSQSTAIQYIKDEEIAEYQQGSKANTKLIVDALGDIKDTLADGTKKTLEALTKDEGEDDDEDSIPIVSTTAKTPDPSKFVFKLDTLKFEEISVGDLVATTNKSGPRIMEVAGSPKKISDKKWTLILKKGDSTEELTKPPTTWKRVVSPLSKKTELIERIVDKTKVDNISPENMAKLEKWTNAFIEEAQKASPPPVKPEPQGDDDQGGPSVPPPPPPPDTEPPPPPPGGEQGQGLVGGSLRSELDQVNQMVNTSIKYIGTSKIEHLFRITFA